MKSEETKPIPTPSPEKSGNPALHKAVDDLNEALQLRIDGRFVPIELTNLPLKEFIYPTLYRKESKMQVLRDRQREPKRKVEEKVKRGAAERSFREVSPSGELEPNLAYTIKQTAEFLQLSEDLVLKMCKNRTLKSSQHENAYRIKGSVILDYLEGK